MKVALIHDHFAQEGGAEKVLEVLAEIFPDAPIYFLLAKKENLDKYFPNRKVHTSIIQKMPGSSRFYRWYMPFMPMAVEFFDLRNYDVVISSTSSFAKGVVTSDKTLHICYCHTPTRYLWSDTHQYINELSYNKFFKKLIALSLNYIRIWDKLAADRVDKFIANSAVSQKRIAKYYRRKSEIIYPSIEDENFYISDKIEDYYLAGCRLVPYKRIDIIIEAFKQMPDKKLKIFGDGIDLPRLKKIAFDAPNIEFLGRVSPEEKFKLYSRAKAYIHPQKEDFGITAVESMASGRPVLAYKMGGAVETIKEGESGLFFEFDTAEEIRKTVERFEKEKDKFSSEKIREKALVYSKKNFAEKIKKFTENEWRNFRNEIKYL